MHAADEWSTDDAALERCRADIARGDIVIATMLFLEDHIRAVMPSLAARRDGCDAMLCGMSAGEVVRLTRLGKLSMSEETLGAIGVAQAIARQSIGRRVEWPGADEDVAAVARAAPVHSRQGAGSARLLSCLAILAGGLGGQSRQPGSHAHRALRRRASCASAEQAARGATHPLSGGRTLSSACAAARLRAA